MEMTKRKLLNGARFLSFTVDNEDYCMDILRVKELMGITKITPLPRTPEFIRGIINLRGQIIPVIDLRLKFGLEFREYTKRTSIIVVEVNYNEENMLMGLVVDSIQEVINIPDDKLSKIPYINARIKSEYIKGIADTPDGMKIVLDVLKVLSDEELAAVKQTAAIKEEQKT
ncbi:MAG: chemotaxis protein CheW [Treponema sp.]|jgi:purine-binding chemotaxis protein CheW|nr:chemotaxis protein CheW [Treponema sp.]